MEKPEGMKPFGKPRIRWEYNIKVDLKEGGWMAWTRFIWLRMWVNGGLL
jgi:hypothetical protein